MTPLHTISICLIAAMACARAPGAPVALALPPSLDREARAAAALERLGVPTHRDAAGHVRWIEATNGEMTDDAMRHLPRLRRLEWLEIGGGKVTASGFVHLAECTALKRLYLHDIALGDDAPWLGRLTRLQALSLERTGIGGRTLAHLNAARTLMVLNLGGNEIGDADLSLVAHSGDLEVLALHDTRVTAAGLVALRGMMRLNVLNIINCRVDDSALDSFITMPNLRIVHAAGTRITAEPVRILFEKLPVLSIFL